MSLMILEKHTIDMYLRFVVVCFVCYYPFIVCRHAGIDIIKNIVTYYVAMAIIDIGGFAYLNRLLIHIAKSFCHSVVLQIMVLCMDQW